MGGARSFVHFKPSDIQTAAGCANFQPIARDRVTELDKNMKRCRQTQALSSEHNKRLVATGFIVVPSSYVGAPALQPQRWASE